MANIEGPVSPLVTDAMKFQCSNCNGSKFYISTTMDEPIDVVQDTDFAALKIEAAGGHFCGLVCLCVQCGHQQVPFWYIIDKGQSDGSDITMDHLDSDRDDGTGGGNNTTTNLLIGLYAVYLGDDATDKGKYFTISANDASEGVVITPDGTLDAATDGPWMITNILPVGWTLAG